MNGAFLVNAAILIVAAATFYPRHASTEIQDAHAMLDSLLGHQAGPLSPLPWRCSVRAKVRRSPARWPGRSRWKAFCDSACGPWLRRLVTRSLAIVPAVAVILWAGRDGSVYQLLILSQVILSLQLSFAVVPLVRFTGSKQKMGPFVNRWWVQLRPG